MIFFFTYLILFWNPVMGQIGWFSGQDLDYGPPVDDQSQMNFSHPNQTI